MKIPKNHFMHSDAQNAWMIRKMPWHLMYAEGVHKTGYPLKQDTIREATWWAYEAEECLRALITHHWSDLEPDGKAFAAAWDQSDR